MSRIHQFQCSKWHFSYQFGLYFPKCHLGVNRTQSFNHFLPSIFLDSFAAKGRNPHANESFVLHSTLEKKVFRYKKKNKNIPSFSSSRFFAASALCSLMSASLSTIQHTERKQILEVRYAQTLSQ